jgi:acyl carrier protein
MESLEHLEKKIKELIIDALALEELSPEQIESTQPLFGDGLGLDSIDALEIAVILETHYGVVVDDDAEENQKRFASIRSIARYVTERRTK